MDKNNEIIDFHSRCVAIEALKEAVVRVERHARWNILFGFLIGNLWICSGGLLGLAFLQHDLITFTVAMSGFLVITGTIWYLLAVARKDREIVERLTD